MEQQKHALVVELASILNRLPGFPAKHRITETTQWPDVASRIQPLEQHAIYMHTRSDINCLIERIQLLSRNGREAENDTGSRAARE